MTVTINGTTGIAGTNGSAGTPAVQGEDTNTGIFFPAADTVAVATAGTERVRVTSAGDVGVGTASPAEKLSVAGAIRTHTASSAGFTLDAKGGLFDFVPGSVNVRLGYVPGTSGDNSGVLTFLTGSGAERGRIDADGRFLVGKTTGNAFFTNGFEVEQAGNIRITSTNDTAQFYRKTSAGSNGVFLTYSDVGSTGGLVGAAFANGTFGTVSDANKKKNVEDARGYLDDLMQIRVVKYNWITDEDTAPKELGWIAQEVEQVFPGMVSSLEGTKLLKKEVFLPMLLKALQEQQALITDLTARVAELEAK